MTAVRAEDEGIVEISSELYEKVLKLRKLKKSGVPVDAVLARCHAEGVDPRWVLEQDGATVRVAPAGTALALTSNAAAGQGEAVSGLFRVSVSDGSGDVIVDFLDGRAPLTALLRMYVATIQRRGQLDVKTGTGTYLSAKLTDLKNAMQG